jgi:hypothetical protein
LSNLHFYEINYKTKLNDLSILKITYKINKDLVILPIIDSRKLEDKSNCYFVLILTFPYCDYETSRLENFFTTYYSPIDLPNYLQKELASGDTFNSVVISERNFIEKNKVYIQLELLETKLEQREILYSPFQFLAYYSIFKELRASSIWIPILLGLPLYRSKGEFKLRVKVIENSLILIQKEYNNKYSILTNFYNRKGARNSIESLNQFSEMFSSVNNEILIDLIQIYHRK